MDISYVHLLVDKDGTATVINKPMGLGAEKYITISGEYQKVATPEGISDIVLNCDNHDRFVSLTIFLQEK